MAGCIGDCSWRCTLAVNIVKPTCKPMPCQLMAAYKLRLPSHHPALDATIYIVKLGGFPLIPHWPRAKINRVCQRGSAVQAPVTNTWAPGVGAYIRVVKNYRPSIAPCMPPHTLRRCCMTFPLCASHPQRLTARSQKPSAVQSPRTTQTVMRMQWRHSPSRTA